MAYRILSLDGGGPWALIEVKALIALYGSPNITGHEVLSDFNLVAANSGGNIVLGGLVENLTLGRLLDYFQDEAKRKSIFSPTTSCAETPNCCATRSRDGDACSRWSNPSAVTSL